MKRTVLVVALTLIGAFAFAQERIAIAVFPFEDMDKVFTGNESVFFYRRFSNEFVNKNNGRFRVIPRQDVEKLINTEATFQLSDFSAKAKTAEMQRVLNGAQILSGYIGKVGNKITISISLFTYPNLEQLPGGVDLDVVNVNELFDKIPELVQSMQNAIESNIPPPPPPKTLKIKKTWTTSGTIFENYSIYNTLAIFGYAYSPDLPLGFSLGFFGIYTSLGFALPNWGEYKKIGTGNSETKKYSNLYYTPNYNSSQILDQRIEMIDWVIGYNITIIPKILYLPVGVGTEAVKEWRLQKLLDYKGAISLSESAEWNPAPQWENRLLLEAGLLFRPTNAIQPFRYKNISISPYIFGTYQYIIPDKHTFSIGGGVSFENF